MKAKKSFVLYTTWRSFFELLEDPELITELLFAIFDLVEGKDVVITNNKVRTAFNAIEVIMKDDFEAYESKCEKNKLAAQKRWNNPSAMRSHADAMRMDGDNDTDNDNDNETDTDMSVLPRQEAPSVEEVMEASHKRGIEMPESDAKEFVAYYYDDLKGQINGEPIRNWRNLLKSWGEHMLVEIGTVLGANSEGYEAFLKLPEYLQKRIETEQEKFGGCRITRATARAITELGKAV